MNLARARRRLLAHHRYERRCLNLTDNWVWITPAHDRLAVRLAHRYNRLHPVRERTVWPCPDCGLPDPYNGHGDGIGSCDCPRCDGCGWIRSWCQCDRSDDYDDWDDELDDDTPWTTIPDPTDDTSRRASVPHIARTTTGDHTP